MRYSRIKKYDNRVIMEEEHTCKYFLSCGDFLNSGVVGPSAGSSLVPRQSLVKWSVCVFYTSK
jgi:hypothetical protein